ncbi:type 1 glutamine amidotransferase [Aspergillus stella-maris]|uniref:type 1 glutamine amidotransferase n=1 Tax=Aspergillus stella-maris TaxID=1810926 RepID=UPI003CCDE80F
MAPITPLRIAIIINTDEAEPVRLFKQGYSSIFKTLDPNATVTFYDPVVAQVYPDPNAYDLIVVGGGTYIPGDESSWMVNLRGFLKSMVGTYEGRKMVGICLGHQTLATMLGGNMSYLSSGPELGITEFPLTEQGKEFFGSDTLRLQEFHMRVIDVTPTGFTPLADGGQIFLSEKNTVLTFQGHPEMSNELARFLLSRDSDYVTGESDAERAQIVESGAGRDDGLRVWKRILDWVRE